MPHPAERFAYHRAPRALAAGGSPHRYRSRRLIASAGSALLIVATASILSPVVAATPPVQSWYGKVVRVVDGDTVEVDVNGTGRVTVRNAGIQATELSEVGGAECHAVEAYDGMRELLPVGSRVRLRAYYANSANGFDPSGRPRPIRYVERWQDSTERYSLDVQRVLLRQGLVIWKPEAVESLRNAEYHVPMSRAMAERRGMFDRTQCGTGPAQGTMFRMWSNYDADGDDRTNLGGEYVRIQNLSANDLLIAGWYVRDASHTFTNVGGSPYTYFRFPAGSVIPSRSYITLYPTSGTQDPRHGRFFFDGSYQPYFPNVEDPDLGYPGKAVYLLDPQLDWRAWAEYPCFVDCRRPPVHISSVSYDTAVESVSVQLDDGVTRDVDLSATVIQNDGWTYEIAPGTVLRPGETLTVVAQGAGTDTRLMQHWRHVDHILEDGGDTVVLRTAWATPLSVYTWGAG